MNSDKPSLDQEVAFLSEIHKRQGYREYSTELASSLGGFLVFWFAGAAIFGAVEVSPICRTESFRYTKSNVQSWSYGDSLYFCYVFFLSIGYGDLGRV